MKKIIAMLVVATMLLTGVMAITASAADVDVVYTFDVKEKNDNTIDVTLKVNSDAKAFYFCQMNLRYNASAIEVVKDSVKKVWNIGDDDTFKASFEEAGWYVLEYEAADETVGIPANGTMLTMTFKVLDATADYGFEIEAPNGDLDNHLILPDPFFGATFEVKTNVIPAETTAPEDDETTAPEDDETTAPVVDETTAPEDDETTAPVVDETTAPEVDETTKPATKPQSPQTGDSMIYVAVIAVIALAACSTVVVVRSKKSSK